MRRWLLFYTVIRAITGVQLFPSMSDRTFCDVLKPVPSKTIKMIYFNWLQKKHYISRVHLFGSVWYNILRSKEKRKPFINRRRITVCRSARRFRASRTSRWVFRRRLGTRHFIFHKYCNRVWTLALCISSFSPRSPINMLIWRPSFHVPNKNNTLSFPNKQQCKQIQTFFCRAHLEFTLDR